MCKVHVITLRESCSCYPPETGSSKKRVARRPFTTTPLPSIWFTTSALLRSRLTTRALPAQELVHHNVSPQHLVPAPPSQLSIGLLQSHTQGFPPPHPCVKSAASVLFGPGQPSVCVRVILVSSTSYLHTRSGGSAGTRTTAVSPGGAATIYVLRCCLVVMAQSLT